MASLVPTPSVQATMRGFLRPLGMGKRPAKSPTVGFFFWM
jgi:hypothetical protein